MGGFSAVIILFCFSAPPKAKPIQASWPEKLLQMDVPGTFIIIASTICYLLAMQWGGATKAWSNSDVIGTLVGFGLLLILFIIIEWQMGEHAFLNSRLLKQRNILVGNLVNFFRSGGTTIIIYYIPIYFQAIRNVSAEESGIRFLPFILSIGLITALSGATISTTGRFMELMIGGVIIATIGTGLISTFNIDTLTGKWIGYQILAGAGHGLSLQVPMILSQASVAPSDLSSVTAIVLFGQTIGGSLFVSTAQAVFVNQLVRRLPPNVSPGVVMSTGSSQLYTVFSGKQLTGVLTAYMDGLKAAFILSTVLVGASVIISIFLEPVNLKGTIQPPIDGGGDP